MEIFSSQFPCTTIRFAAIFSDWCEHPPLYSLLSTWFSGRWDHRILAGKGESAIPYLHINDLIRLFHCLINESPQLLPYQVLNASHGYCTSHSELFQMAYAYYYFQNVKPIYLPKWFITIGLLVRNTVVGLKKINGSNAFG